MTWHVDSDTAQRYATRRIDAARAASVESHVMTCAACRALVGSTLALDDVLDHVWNAVTDELDEPALGRIERLLVRCGCSQATARIVAATSRARWSYLGAVAASLLLALVAAKSSHEQFFGAFLVVAPLGPLVAAASAFGRWSDPLYEVAQTAPTSSLRILLVRTCAAAAPALAITALSIPWLLDQGWLAAAWLLPSLALALGALALSSWLPVEAAASVVAAVWLVPFVVLRLPVAELLDVFAGPLQLAAVAVVAGSVLVTALRRSAFEYREA